MPDNKHYTEFYALMELLFRYYRQKPSGEDKDFTIADYYRQLKMFGINFIEAAIDRAPGAYPSGFMPTVGQLRVLCEQAVAEFNYGREEKEAHGEMLKMVHCRHEFVWEPEPEGSFFLGFDVCIYCPFSKPKISNNPKHAEAKRLLAKAMKPKDRPQGNSREHAMTAIV